MPQRNISNAAHRAWPIRLHHLLEIHEERLVHRQEVVDVAKERLGLVRREDRGALGARELAKRVCIVVLEDSKALDVGYLGIDEFGDHV